MSVINETKNVLASLGRNESVNKTANDDAQTRFLTLLTTQLRNQDPMNPLENAEVTSQLAQMSTVDGIERLNKMFQKFLDAQEAAETMNAAALVGRGVLVPGKGMILTEAGGVGGFVLDTPAQRVTLSIRDSAGIEVAKIELDDVEAGSHNYVWDGTSVSGERAASGLYTVSVTASEGDKNVAARTLEFGQVTGVMRGPRGADLQVGSLGIFQFNDIKQIL
ncbi:flagellar hook assembly protein FlgD [Azoarcus taiwanensis]|uniref:Basal-body rod modification protein FlgD n=1 Tax=Azoarcus taiwanensis TaxID=666964 RepID=A0A972J8B0_9RHOO|nr:flagellar hook assembly protein FlgD [Azoarcus taiwanensis]NMG02931.1 flagellar hook assembly protein FlgD [Azoarcus taiwanensis]